MVVMALPLTVSDFEGVISRAAVAGNETLVFVKLTAWQSEWEKINAKIQESVFSLKKVMSLLEVKSGEVYIAKVNDSFERAYIIRRPMPETYAIYLIDKGTQCEVTFGEIYEYPPELLEFGVFDCVCPVMVPSTEELDTYKGFVGFKCKCIVESVSKSVMIMGFIRGRLLINIGGNYEGLQEIIDEKITIHHSSSGHSSVNLHVSGSEQTGQLEYSSSSSNESIFRKPSTQVGLETSTSSLFMSQDRKDFAASKREKPVHTVPEFVAGRDKAKVGTLFNQRAFKQYVPEMLPITVAARFDKKDRMMNTFWVVNKKIFADAERALKEVGDELSRFPPITQRRENIRMRDTPCIVRARADITHKSLYRAVPAQYDAYTNRVSIFLVDFGWFKWVLASDVFDISSMHKSNPVRNLPVAMIHCYEDKTSTLHARDLIKGTNCEIIIKGNALGDVYTVDLVEPSFMSDQMDGIPNGILNGISSGISNGIPNGILNSISSGISNGIPNGILNGISSGISNGIPNGISSGIPSGQPINEGRAVADNMRETEVISSCKKLVTETCQRQLMTSMIMETLNIASRELAQQPQNFWPSFYRPTFPMAMPLLMPVAFPVMFPIPFPNSNLQSSGDNVAVRPGNMMANNFENVDFSNNNSRPGIRGTSAIRGTSTVRGTSTIRGTSTVRGTIRGTSTVRGTSTMRGTSNVRGTSSTRGITIRGTSSVRGASGMRRTNNRSPKTDYVQRNGARFQNKNFQPAKEWSHTESAREWPHTEPANEWSRINFSFNDGIDAAANDQDDTPVNNDISWDLPPNSIKPRRKIQISLPNTAQNDQQSTEEKNAAADPTVHDAATDPAVHDEQDHDPSPSGGD